MPLFGNELSPKSPGGSPIFFLLSLVSRSSASPAPTDELTMILDTPTVKTRKSCRRASSRQTCSLSVRFQVVGFHTDVSRPAVGRDLSATGIGLLTKAPIRPGTCLRLYLNATARDAGVSRAVIVRHFTREASDRWVIGCSFSRELSAGELAALVD
jgi:hypothetical protein